MKTNRKCQKVSARFSPETRFELTPWVASLTSDLARQQFEQLKARLLGPVLEDVSDSVLRRQLELAANEAAAVAWTSSFPLLALPVLLQEKADEVHQHAVRQEKVLQTSHALAVEAV